MLDTHWIPRFGLITDIDGTVLQDGTAIAGCTSFLATVARAGGRVVFVTNRTVTPKAGIHRELQRAGIPCRQSQILTAAEAAARRVRGKRVFVIGEEGLLAEISMQAAEVTDESPDAVVVGLKRSITYRDVELAARLISSGATFLATNLDARYYSDEGICPGAGAFVETLLGG